MILSQSIVPWLSSPKEFGLSLQEKQPDAIYVAYSYPTQSSVSPALFMVTYLWVASLAYTAVICIVESAVMYVQFLECFVNSHVWW